MHWYFMRHGEAVPVGGGVPGDDRRPLSPSGRAEVERCATGLRHLGVELDAVLTSPLARARETAAIIATGLGGPTVMESPDLRPGVPTDLGVAALEPYRQRRLLVVGHQPDLGQLLARLVAAGSSVELSFRKAAVCCVNVTWGAGPAVASLEWFVTPDQLGRIGPRAT